MTASSVPVLTPAGILLARSMVDTRRWGARSALLDAVTFAGLTYGTDFDGFVWATVGDMARWIGTADRTIRTRGADLAAIGVMDVLWGRGRRPTRWRVLAPRSWRVEWRPGCSIELAERRLDEHRLFHVEPSAEDPVDRAVGRAINQYLDRAPKRAVRAVVDRAPKRAVYDFQTARPAARSSTRSERAAERAVYEGRESVTTPDDASTAPFPNGGEGGRRFDQQQRKKAGVLAHHIREHSGAQTFGAPFEGDTDSLCALVADFDIDVGWAIAWIRARVNQGDHPRSTVRELTRAWSAELARPGLSIPEPTPVTVLDQTERDRRAAALAGEDFEDERDAPVVPFSAGAERARRTLNPIDQYDGHATMAPAVEVAQ